MLRIYDKDHLYLGDGLFLLILILKATVTQAMVDANMQDVAVKTIQCFDKPCTYVEVRMKNGFTVRETTTCVDPANYSEEIGKEICLKRIENEVWKLLGFELQSKLYGTALVEE